MSAKMRDMMRDNLLLFHNRGLLRWSVLGLGLPLVLILFFLFRISRAGLDARAIPLAGFLILMVSTYTAFIVAFPQKEILNRPFSWCLPNQPRRTLRVLLSWLVVVGALAACLFSSVGAYGGLIGWPQIASFACLASTLFGLTVAMVLLNDFTAFLPTGFYFFLFFLTKPIVGFAPETAARFLGRPWLWLLALGVVLTGLNWLLRGKFLHRRLCGKNILSPGDVINSKRMSAYWTRRGAGRGVQAGTRPFADSLKGLLRRAALAGAEDRVPAQHGWLWTYLWLGMHLCRSRRRLLGAWLVYGIFLVLLGYADTSFYYAGSDLDHYFAGLVFMGFTAFGSLGGPLALEPVPHTMSRRKLAVFLPRLALVLSLVATGLGGLLWAFFNLLSHLMPSFTMGTRLVIFQGPFPHVIFLAALMIPWQFLVYSLRRSARQTLNAVGIFLFFFFHALLTMSHQAWWAYAGVGITLILGWAFFLGSWRRTARRGDF